MTSHTFNSEEEATQYTIERYKRISRAVQAGRDAIFSELKNENNTMPGIEFLEVALGIAELAVRGEGGVPPEQSYENCKAFIYLLVDALKPQPAQMLM